MIYIGNARGTMGTQRGGGVETHWRETVDRMPAAAGIHSPVSEGDNERIVIGYML